MKTLAFMLCLAAVFSLAAESRDYSYGEIPPFAAGVQILGVGWGLSGLMDLNDDWSMQAVAGPFGRMNIYAVRGLYSLYRQADWNAYAFGQLAHINNREEEGDPRETAFSVGGGVGVQYDWSRLHPDMPPLIWSIEAGLMSDKLDNRDISGVRVGGGVHYRF